MRQLLLAAVLCSTTTLAAPLTVSVLYFDNDTGKSDFEPLKKGLADMLTSDLSQLPGVTLVERERLQAVLDEQKLTQTRFFDAKTAAQTGKLLGATHVVTGSMVAVEPKLRLDIRLTDVNSGRVLVTGQVVGRPEDLFELEQELVRRFAAGLAVNGKGLVTSRANLAALLAYSRGLEATDHGDLEAARAPLTSALQAAPQFDLARRRYTELLAKLDAATKVRTDVLGEDERILEQHITEWTSLPPSTVSRDRAIYVVGYHVAKYKLGVARLRRLVGPSEAGHPAIVPPSRLAELARLESQTLLAGAQLAARVRVLNFRPSPTLFPDDQQRLLALFGSGLLSFSSMSEGDARQASARLALLGRDQEAGLFYRPTLAQRDPSSIATHLAGLEVQIAEVGPGIVDLVTWNAADEGAEGLLLAGQREAAIARWQKFLDANPTSTHFAEGRERIEELLLVTPALATGLAALQACKPEAQLALNAVFKAVGRAEGRAGLQRVLERVEQCAPKQGALAMGWRTNGYVLAADQALHQGDCSFFKVVRAKSATLGEAYGSVFKRYTTRCDEL